MLEHEHEMKLPAIVAAASTSIGATLAAHLPLINEWMRFASYAVAIISGLFSLALLIRRWINRKD